MKSGEIAAALGITPDTVKNWAKHPQLERFFSAGAKGEDGNFQRTFTESDVLVLSTVHRLRTSGTTNWREIAAFLDSGERHQEFPQNAVAADPRTIPIQQAEQSAKAAATLAERDAALRQVQELQTQLAQIKRDHREEIERIRDDYKGDIAKLQREVRDLLREIGRLEGRLESLDEGE